MFCIHVAWVSLVSLLLCKGVMQVLRVRIRACMRCPCLWLFWNGDYVSQLPYVWYYVVVKSSLKHMLVRNASPRGPMCFKCLMFNLSGPCGLLFLLCFIIIEWCLWIFYWQCVCWWVLWSERKRILKKIVFGMCPVDFISVIVRVELLICTLTILGSVLCVLVV